MRSFRTKVDSRKGVFLSLSAQIERQLREAYHQRYTKHQVTQAGLADKLGVNRSAINRRLTGKANMTVKTLADMAWALGHVVEVNIYDPAEHSGRNSFPQQASAEGKIVDAIIGRILPSTTAPVQASSGIEGKPARALATAA